jgi:hypothetical protein
MEDVNMYAHILSSALNDWVDELTGDALVDYALVCRTEMRRPPQYQGETALIALAAEVAYDRALIKLCEAHGIGVVDLSFLHPRQERARLEAALVAAGIDLAGRDQGRQT